MKRRVPGVPALVAVAALAAVALVAVPLFGLAWQAPWPDVLDDLTSEPARTALRLSAVCSVGATAVALALGLPLAWTLARATFPGRRLVRGLTLVPLVMPPVVGGVALLLAFGRNGLVGQRLDTWFGVRLPFTTAGAILAEAFVAIPFVVITAEAAFEQVDRRVEDAARTLGAGEWAVFRRVTLPLAMPTLAAGAALAWARALGEFGATITFAGNSPGRTQTVPLEVYLALESGNTGAAIGLSLLLVAVSFAVIVALRGRWLGLVPSASAPATSRRRLSERRRRRWARG